MKKISQGLIIVSLCLFSIHANAQIVALKGGFNLSTFSVSEEFGLDYESTPGFHIGTTFDIPLGDMFAVETGILATTKGWQSESSFGGESSKITVNILNAEVPLSFKTIFGVSDNLDIYASAGGYIGVALAGVSRYKTEILGETSTYTNELGFDENGRKRLDYGLTFGAGIEVKGFIVGASYDLGLADINGSEFVEESNRVLKFSIGYRFGWDN